MSNVAIILNLLKHTEKKKWLKDIPFDYLSFVIDAIFSELKEMEKLHINGNKIRTLNDFLSSFPYMSDMTCTYDRIIQGLIDVGMLDAKHKFLPNFSAIKKNKEKKYHQIWKANYWETFSQLFKIMLKMGHIP